MSFRLPWTPAPSYLALSFRAIADWPRPLRRGQPELLAGTARVELQAGDGSIAATAARHVPVTAVRLPSSRPTPTRKCPERHQEMPAGRTAAHTGCLGGAVTLRQRVAAGRRYFPRPLSPTGVCRRSANATANLTVTSAPPCHGRIRSGGPRHDRHLPDIERILWRPGLRVGPSPAKRRRRVSLTVVPRAGAGRSLSGPQPEAAASARRRRLQLDLVTVRHQTETRGGGGGGRAAVSEFAARRRCQ